MTFRLTVRRKISTTELGEPEVVKAAGAEGVFEAQAINFARTACNDFIRRWAEGVGVTVRSQKDWTKNMRTKALERQVMVQNAGKPESYVFVLEEK